ncbi:hypothetical protein GUITHDRAFT_148112 [Guillardia theta CCMP2712]|uniref:Alginate lyase domain-containing protein n=1 Tax=Guillardia theta (strain CCMP2712) TaxID=905079 RepID=L1IAN6_GUITC|nr:hypothetical protein GUITHDRAFT_148112 [Guillardia theta CCMP2712]EKX33172.1 hypothetical protein GUITHDRAFT_148112 [Guillardia theta CCMP2712]|eukprot:XP_005820152.1 hypothetical protein GUITHDRAFT_148112 [Guillardia theta CCMP2712]
MLVKLFILASLLLASSCEEDSSSSGYSGGNVAVKAGSLAGYVPVSDVKEHSEIDLDLRGIELAKNDWTAAKKIYTEGGGSMKSSDPVKYRTLQDMANIYKDPSSTFPRSEPFAKMAHAFWQTWTFADDHMRAVLDGKDEVKYGTYATGDLAKTDSARSQMTKKLAQYTIDWLYVLHEIEGALAGYNDVSLGNSRFEANGAAHTLDEAWAFYVGSLEDGSQEDGEVDGQGLGYAPYMLAEKMSKDFKTYGYIIGNGGSSRVNWELMYQFTAAQRYLQTPDKAAEVAESFKCIRAQLMVPVVQACIVYSYEASSADITSDSNLAKIKAEAWAFCAAALPWLHDVDPTAAAKVKEEVIISNAKRPNWSVVKESFSGKNLNKMGIKCDDIGSLDEAYPNAKFDKCSDDKSLFTSSYARSDVCGNVKMPKQRSVGS